MPNETQNSGAENVLPLAIKADSRAIPEEFIDLVVERVVRVLYRRNPALKRKPGMKSRMVTQKIYNFDNANFANVLAALCTESAGAQTLLVELRQARADYIAAAGAKYPNGKESS
jgi:hypothetical protein